MRLTRTGASSSARLAVRAGSAAVTAGTIPRPIAGRRPPVPPMNSSVPPGLTLLTALRATWSASNEVRVDVAAHLREVHVEEAPVVRPASGHHHVVDRGRQVTKEPLEGSGIRGVEGRGAQRVELVRGALEAARDSGR